MLKVLDNFADHRPSPVKNASVGKSHTTSPGIHLAIQDSTTSFDDITHFSATYLSNATKSSAWQAKIDNKPEEDEHKRGEFAEVILPSSALNQSHCLGGSDRRCIRRVMFTVFGRSAFFQEDREKSNVSSSPLSLIVSTRLLGWTSVRLRQDVKIVFSRPTNLGLVSDSVGVLYVT